MNFGDDRLPPEFWSKVQPEPNSGCWLWVGAWTTSGYGSRTSKRRRSYPHRDAFTVARGVIPAGLDLDHLCRTRCCCNPDHLEAVTHETNMKRSPLGFQNRETQKELAMRSAARPLHKKQEAAAKAWRTRRQPGRSL